MNLLVTGAWRCTAQQLDKPQIGELVDLMVQEQTVADHTLHPLGIYRQGIAFILHKRDIVTHIPDFIQLLRCASPGTRYQ